MQYWLEPAIRTLKVEFIKAFKNSIHNNEVMLGS